MLNKKTKIFLVAASLLMALGIVLGAFGAHILKQFISDELMAVYETGVKYQFFNTLGLFAIALILQYKPDSKLLFISGILIIIGTLLFSVSLYLLVILKLSWLGAITPIGGTLLIIAWVLTAVGIIKK